MFQCLLQKSEAEKKLSTLTFQEANSSNNDPLIRHLQEELRNFVCWIPFHVLFPFLIVVKLYNHTLMHGTITRETHTIGLILTVEFALLFT